MAEIEGAIGAVDTDLGAVFSRYSMSKCDFFAVNSTSLRKLLLSWLLSKFGFLPCEYDSV